MTQILAHSLDSNRTRDVIADENEENLTFESLMLNENVLRGITKSGFKKPSPIQIKAIPVGRCGFDLIVRSKSGTGKTLVYSIIALETINVHKSQTEVLILAPTREIAVQIEEVLVNIGSNIEGLKVKSFIGGLSIEGDKEKCKACHIAVGAPGRVKHLISEGILKTNSIRLMVLDEVDKLMESSFLNDINEIYNSLPDRKQIITTSATYSNELKNILGRYMLSPIYIAVENYTPLLLGLKQFVKVIKPHANVVQQMKIKNEEILNIFSNISFTQCLVFTNYQTRAQSISNILNQKGWHSTYISAAQNQTERLATVKDLKNFKCRIMLSTDLTARGIDAANVDLVINYDIPIDAITYLHRMGRAGRYGSAGICINLAFDGNELQQLQNLLGVIGGQSLSIPKLPKFDGTVVDLLSVQIPSENQIYGTLSKNINTATTKVNIKKNILELKTSKKHSEKNKQEESKEKQADLSKNYPEIECKNAEDQIMDILNIAKKEVEIISENLSDVDPSIILKSLASGGLKMDSNAAGSSSSYPDLQQLILSDAEECKKRKRSSEAGAPELFDSKNDLVLEKQKAEDSLYYKNRALLSMTNILCNERCSDAFDADSIQRYLENLKDQEKKEVNKVMMNSKCQNEMDLLKNIDKYEYLPDNCPNLVINECASDIESIFKIGYESAIKSDSKQTWQSYLPEAEIREFNNLCLKETSQEEIEEDVYNDYDMEEQYYSDKELTYESYDNNTSDKDDSNENFMKWIPVEKTTERNYGQILESDISNWEHLYTHFGHCNDYLWQNGLSFQHVEDFDDWFRYEWQAQVFAVRNYTQQYIYVQEMKKYQETQDQQNEIFNKNKHC